MREIVILGGAGFIGANLVRMLGRAPVTVFDNFSSGAEISLPEHVEVIEGDIRDQAALSAALGGARTVIHLAASGSVVASIEDPLGNFDVNVRGTINVLHACGRSRVDRLVFASTGGALIGDAVPPVSEMSLPRPISPYGASKLCGEAYCHAFAKSYGLHTIALRFANVYGPFSEHKKGAVTKFIQCLMRDEPLTIYGDGSASRDYLHVSDLCRGIIAALGADLPPGDVIHLASGVETRVDELARLLCEVAGKPDHPMQRLPRRDGEVERNFARFDKAREVLGFSPEHALREGLASTWTWFTDPLRGEDGNVGVRR